MSMATVCSEQQILRPSTAGASVEFVWVALDRSGKALAIGDSFLDAVFMTRLQALEADQIVRVAAPLARDADLWGSRLDVLVRITAPQQAKQ